MDNIEVVRAAMQQVYGEQRLEQIDHYWATDFVQHSSYWGPGGRQELRESTARLVAGIPDLAATLDHVLASGDLGVAFTTWTGTVRGDLPDFSNRMPRGRQRPAEAARPQRRRCHPRRAPIPP